MQVSPIKPTLKPPETKRLKQKDHQLLSTFAFKFNLHHYIKARSKSHQRRAQGLPLTVEEKFDVFYRATVSKEATLRQLEVTFEAGAYTCPHFCST